MMFNPAAPYRPHMMPKLRSKLIMDAPKAFYDLTGTHAPCTLCLASFIGEQCYGNETCVMCHLPIDGKGMSTKVTDLATVFGCMKCHTILDQGGFQTLVERYPVALAQQLIRAHISTQTYLMWLDIMPTPEKSHWI